MSRTVDRSNTGSTSSTDDGNISGGPRRTGRSRDDSTTARLSSGQLTRLAIAAKLHLWEREAITKFCDDIKPLVLGTAHKIVHKVYPSKQCAYDVDDLAQEVYMRLLLVLDTYDPTKAPFGGFVWIIARNAWLDMLHDVKREMLASLDEAVFRDEPDPCSSIDEHVDARRCLEKFRARLSATSFLFVVANASGSSADDLAETHKINRETVKSRICRSRKQCADVVPDHPLVSRR